MPASTLKEVPIRPRPHRKQYRAESMVSTSRIVLITRSGVQGFGSTTFVLQAQQNLNAPSRLFDGQPQRIVAARDTWRYFKFSAPPTAE